MKNHLLSFDNLVAKSITKKVCALIIVLSFFSIEIYGQTITVPFSYTGATQNWTVPAGVTSITVKIWGAGGGGSNGSGGSGALVKGTLAVTPGSTIAIVVGGGGAYSSSGASSGGFGGGGPSGGAYGGSGGGYSGIFNSSVSFVNALAVAGGGAGGGYYGNATYGGAGGATTGSNGGNYNSNYTGGYGGTVSAGGGKALWNGSPDSDIPNTGSALQGGTGGVKPSHYSGGGGGGGYYGGGGGYCSKSSTYYSSGGGGGSSYLGSMTSTTNTAGTINSSGGTAQAPGSAETGYIAGVGNGGGDYATGGNGLIVISYSPCPTNVSAGSDVTICSGSSFQLSGSATAPTVTIFSEDFESYAAGELLTTGSAWKKTEITDSGADWQIASGCTSIGTQSLNMNDGYGHQCDYAWDGAMNSVAWYGTPIDATEFNNLTLNFSWLADGGTDGNDYLMAVYSFDGTTWADISTTKYYNKSSLQEVTNLAMPINLEGQSFYLGFRWVNNITYSGNPSPAPTIDNISITAIPNLTYSWSPTSGLNNANISNPIASPSSTTTYTMTATANGCGVSDDVLVGMRTVPAVPAVSNTGPVCTGATVDLTGSGLAPGLTTAFYNAASNTNSISYSGTTNNFTMEMWVKPTGTIVLTPEVTSGISANLTLGAYNQKFVVYPGYGGAPNGGIGISVGTNGIAVYEHGDGHFPSTLVWSGSLSDWTHIAVVYESKTPRLYINGNYVKTGLTSGRTAVFPTAGVGTVYGNYVGYVDNYRIWNTVRTDVQLRANMYLEDPASTSGMIAHYKFNNNTNASTGTNLTNNGGTFGAQDFYTYTWTGTSAPAASLNETQTTGSLSIGTHVYTVAASAGGCPGTSSSNNTVSVVADPTAPGLSVASPANGSTVCIGATVSASFNAGTGGLSCGDEYQYSTNGGESWSAYTPGNNITASTTGANAIQIQTRRPCSGNGCDGAGVSWATKVQWTVVADPSVSASGSTTICSGLTANLSASGANGTGSATYQWQYWNGGSWVDVGGNSATYTTGILTATTDFRCQYATTGNGCTTGTSNTITVTVDNPSITGLSSGDYLWTGNSGTDWNNPGNWITYNGTGFLTAASVPAAVNNVIFRDFGSSCISNNSQISSASGTCNNITIESGSTVVMSNGRVLNVRGNWSNDGTFTAGDGTVVFNGTAAQTITSGGGAFNNVTFSNSTAGISDINIAEPMVINGVCTFDNGVVFFTETGSLLFGSSSSSDVGSDNSYVNGRITKSGSTAFIFPIGKDDVWAPIGIAAPAALSVITAEYKLEPGPLNWSAAYMCNQDELHHTSGVEHWLLTTSNSTPAVTLYWNNGTRSGISDITQLSVAHYNETTTCWESMGGTAIGNAALGSITSSVPFTSYSPVTFGTKTNDNTLPVEYSSLTAECAGGSVVLNWTTASELNNDYFEVERSIDATDWQVIATLDGAGNSNLAVNYNYTDRLPESKLQYYRLRQVDYDGSSKLSDMVQVRCNDDLIKPSVMLYPNPFNNQLFVATENWDMNSLDMELYDVLGKKLATWSFSGVSPEFVKQLDISDLPPAMYVVKIKTSTGITVRKIEKK